MSDANTQSGNKLTIRKGKIKNLTVGEQVDAPDADAAAHVLKNLPEREGRNEASLGDAEIDSAVVGLRVTVGKASDLAPHIDALAKQVDEAAAAGEITGDDKQDSHAALDRVKTEIAKPKPDGKRVVDNLKKVSDAFESVRKTGENAAKIGKVIVQAAPYAVTVFQAAKALFGIP